MTGDPTRDNKPDSHHFGGTDEPMEDEYAQHAREERERKQRERQDAAHEKAKAERPALVYCKHMDADIYEGTCAMCTPPEPQKVIGNVMARMAAQYETGCDACGSRIRPGEDIALVDGAWVHEEHTEDP